VTSPMRRRAPAPLTVFAIASLGVLMAFVDATIVNIAFPDIGETFPESSISALSWVLNAYNIIFAAFLVAAGRIADLVGRRRMFLLGLFIFTSASVLCAVAPTLSALVVMRVLQALGAALIVPASLALVLDAFPAERRAHAVSLVSAVGALAAGLGPSLGGLLVSAESWRLVFLVNLPVGIAAYVLSRRYLVESRAPGRRRMPDLPGALIFAAAISAFVLGVVKGGDWGWISPGVLGSFAVAAALLALFIRRCRWHRSPIVDLSLLRIRTFSVANAMTIFAAAGFYGYTLVNVLFLTGVWQYSVLEAGLAITPGPFVAAAVAGPTSRLAERAGHRAVLVSGGLIWAAGVLWFVARVGLRPDFVAEWLPGMILLGIGAGTLFPNISAAAVASAPGQSFATATGLNSVARQVGAAIGVAIAVAIIGAPTFANAGEVFDRAWTFSAACLAVAGLGCLGVRRLSPAKTARAPSLASAARTVLNADAPEPSTSPVSPRPRSAHRELPGSHERRPESTADFLAKVPIFAPLPDGIRETLAARARPIRVRAGQWLFREGDPADSLFVIRAGKLEVVSEGAEERILRDLGRGSALGELALLTSSRRSASVRAARDSDLISVAREDFERLLSEAPELSLALARVLGSQLQDSQGAPHVSRAVPVTIALVAQDERVPLADLSARLADGLGRWGSVEVLDGSEASESPDLLDPTAIYAPLLERAEAASDQLILVVPSLLAADAWSRYSLQQADRVLVITAGEPPPASELRAELRGCDLVTWQVPPGSGAAGALAGLLDPIETHALRQGTLDEDIERVARRLAGRSLGIVLSGGGARAFAHIGVLEELVAAGITIDRVAGVSMGAFVGAMFAMEMDGDEIDARCFEEWVRRRPLGDYTIPRHALIRGERARAMLERCFGGVAIEELRRSFVSGASELRSAELVVSRWGPLQEAVGTSVCIPILAPPQVRGRELLVDGSLVDNLPVATMAALGEGPIIAVDVKADFEHPKAETPASSATPTEQQELRTPSLGETLTRVLLLGSSSTSESARLHADLTIKPRAEGVGLLEFHQIDVAREAGRVAARDALERVPASLFLS
jgi:NTE family protein